MYFVLDLMLRMPSLLSHYKPWSVPIQVWFIWQRSRMLVEWCAGVAARATLGLVAWDLGDLGSGLPGSDTETTGFQDLVFLAERGMNQGYTTLFTWHSFEGSRLSPRLA
jgi:hypothetical protein